MKDKHQRRHERRQRRQARAVEMNSPLQTASALFQSGKTNQAVKILEIFLGDQPDNFEALTLLGVIRATSGDPGAALPLFEHAARIRPGDDDIQNNLARACGELGRFDEAIAYYRRSLEIEPNNDVIHINLGNLLKDNDDLTASAACYERALKINSVNAWVHSNLGNVLEGQGRLDDAVTSHQRALEIDPGNGLFHSNLGIALKAQGRLDEAVAAHRRALEIDPGIASIHNNLGYVLEAQGYLDDAASCYREALALKPNYINAHNNLGNVLIELGQLDEAIASYQKALAIDPDYAEGHSNLGVAFKELGQLDEAMASYQKALAIDPDYAEGHSNLGVAFKELRQLDEAVTSYQKALAIKPDYVSVLSNLGNAFYELGKLDEAVASCTNALAIKPDSAKAWNNLKFPTKALMFSKAGGDRTGETGAKGLNDAARSTVGFAIQQSYLNGFRPHEADESFANVIATLPAKADEAIPIGGTDSKPESPPKLFDNVVALLFSGRSGTGLLHSLIDSHPEISTLPSIYLRGYFNEGVWDKISARGWRELPDRFIDEFSVLFDAQSSKPIPSRLGEASNFMGKNEGMTSVGGNRNEMLSVDCDAFRAEALRLMEGLEAVDPMSFFLIVHAAFEFATRTKTAKHLCFYHIHNPDDYAKPNFLRYAPDSRLVMTVREPIQNCESSLRSSLKENDYIKVVNGIIGILYDIDQIAFRMRESVGVRLEDIKTRPKATIQGLCVWLGVEDSPSLYEMTAQGKKWWGDPSSPDYDNTEAMSPFDEASIKRPVGSVFSEKDQFVLGTLFYPFSVRFGYRDPAPDQFKKNLVEVRPLIDEMLDFEKAMAERSSIDHDQFTRKGAYQLLRAGLFDRWKVLDELGDYPHMLKPLSIG